MNQLHNTALSLEQKSHYLSKEQLDYFQNVLIVWRQELRTDYREARQRIRHQNERVGDIVDQSFTENSTTMEMINYRRKGTLLEQVEAALQRIVDGSYVVTVQHRIGDPMSRDAFRHP
ncbi:MAG: hypothetical protein K0A94_12070 [Desulfuromonadales bacterium]|nr:hypothetical protein [Desulfuromonadales bacterium]